MESHCRQLKFSNKTLAVKFLKCNKNIGMYLELIKAFESKYNYLM